MTEDVDDAPGSRMGATWTGDGVTFRVWAPNATEAFVRGSFNEWSERGEPMTASDDGHWSAHVTQAAPGDEYRYRIVNGDEVFDRIDPYAREVTSSVGNAIVANPAFDWGEDDYAMPPWNEAIIYELHIGTFGRKDGDEIATFADAVARFDHLKRLGVNVLQLMPAAEFAGDVSWGYNPAHIFAIETAYGGPNGFKAFVKQAHAAGFAVILDVVYNHFGPSDLDLWRFDGWHDGDGGGIYFYNDWRRETPWGDSRPDYGRPEVQRFIRDNALMWLEEFHVDGLRWDMTLYIRSVRGDGDPEAELPDGWRVMRDVNVEISERHPGVLTIAEDLQNDPALVDREGAGFGSQWDAAFVHVVRAAVTHAEDEARSMDAVRDAILHRYGDDAFRRVVYSESHDEVANGKARVPEEITPGDPASWAAQKRSTLAAALVMTSPGIPMLFQGQEFLQAGWFQDTVPLDWDQTNDFRGILRLYRDLIALRRNRTGVTRGLVGQGAEVHHVDDANNVVAFHRWADGGPNDDVVVLVNLANRPLEEYTVGFPRAGLWRVRLNSDWGGYSPEFADCPAPDVEAFEVEGDGYPCRAAVSCGPYTVLILSQD